MESMVLNKERSADELFTSVMDNTPEASGILMQMFYEDSGFRSIYFCDRMNLRGARLCKLFNECCNMDFNQLKKTLLMIKLGIYSREDIEENLGLDRAIPFFVKRVHVQGMPVFEGDFEPTDEGWRLFCAMNKCSFMERLSNAKKEQSSQMELRREVKGA